MERNDGRSPARLRPGLVLVWAMAAAHLNACATDADGSGGTGGAGGDPGERRDTGTLDLPDTAAGGQAAGGAPGGGEGGAGGGG
ncbi:hypothetical protein L6V77_24030, partial [Myxococcota bacterium]|nr:hypothetical protein [Myxococcota bacterium]